MNSFKVNDIVKTTSGSRVAGKVRYIACYGATTAGGKTCNKKTCSCVGRDYVWVEWTDNKIYSYEYTELAYDLLEQIVAKEIAIVEKKSSVPTIPDLTIEKFDFDMYNGITEVRYTRDGRGYLVSKGGSQEVSKTLVEEKDLDFDTYNNKGLVKKKKS